MLPATLTHASFGKEPAKSKFLLANCAGCLMAGKLWRRGQTHSHSTSRFKCGFLEANLWYCRSYDIFWEVRGSPAHVDAEKK